jgi:hypothetical protein
LPRVGNAHCWRKQDKGDQRKWHWRGRKVGKERGSPGEELDVPL